MVVPSLSKQQKRGMSPFPSTDERLLEAVDNMSFDHDSNMAQVGELSTATKE